MVGDLPNLDDAVFAARSNDVVIMRTPGNVQHRPFVAADEWVIWIDSPYLMVRKKKRFNVNNIQKKKT